MAATLAELARRFGGQLRGNGDVEVSGVAPLDQAQSHHISYVNDRRHRRLLIDCRAGAVVLTAEDAEEYSGNALIVDQPQLCFARIATFLHPGSKPRPGIHPSAVVDAAARVSARASIGPHAVVESGAMIGEGVAVGAGSYVGREAVIGAGTRLVGNVWVGERCVIGKSCLLHPGSVVGGEGFGYAKDGERWVKIPQLGRVVVGDDVEIGANTTIDRGTFNDTEIADGVKLDNLVHIGHNVHVGEHTAMAACVGVSGSVTIGRRCMLAGQVGVVDHVSITDDVLVLGKSMIANSIVEPGAYSSGIPAERAEHWRRQVVRLQQLDELARRVKQLEKEIENLKEERS